MAFPAEFDKKLVFQIHGVRFSSESESDSDCIPELDEEYNLLKPPPLDYEKIKDRIILILPESSDEEHKNEVSTTKKNKQRRKKNPILKLQPTTKQNLIKIVSQNRNVNQPTIFNKPTICELNKKETLVYRRWFNNDYKTETKTDSGIQDEKIATNSNFGKIKTQKK
ncbi:hypothetical protein NQ317_014251 [Molorchus minor]|uniref:Uncharacterized protein n=1 Tax=Molorchus minor TaxID=1323400 RepID=A0ABQ9J6F8_9CUCU|nr:hypothetical protein NQ317_014251 [Molorchus minor]